MMANILARCCEEIPANCLLFYGHDYGVKNLNWACYLMSRSAESRESELMQVVFKAYQNALKNKKEGYASTGIVWSQER